MNLESVKQYLEGDKEKEKESEVANLPPRFIERFVAKGIKVDFIEHGRIVCSMKVQPHLLVTNLKTLISSISREIDFGKFGVEKKKRTQATSYTAEQRRLWWT